MSHRCQTCGEEWPDQPAAKNGYSCTLTGRGALVRFVPPPPEPPPRAKTLEEQAVCAGLSGVVPAGLVASGSRCTAVGKPDGTVRVRAVPSGRELASFADYRGAVNGCEFSPDTAWIASVSADFTLRVNSSDASGAGYFFQAAAPLTAVGWHPDGRSLAVGDAQGQLYLLRLENAVPFNEEARRSHSAELL